MALDVVNTVSYACIITMSMSMFLFTDRCTVMRDSVRYEDG